jgi:hypothetical protein
VQLSADEEAQALQLNAQYHAAGAHVAQQEWVEAAPADGDDHADAEADAADAADAAADVAEQEEWGDGWTSVARGGIERTPDNLWLNVPQLAPGRRCARAHSLRAAWLVCVWLCSLTAAGVHTYQCSSLLGLRGFQL